MSRTTQQIEALYRQRKQRLDPMRRAALEVRRAYYGDLLLPVPEIDANERPLVANLVYEAGEQKAQRIASTMPNIYYPSTRPGIAVRDEQARDRRLVNMAWWDLNRMKLKMRQRARHMVYYAVSAVMIQPDFDKKMPVWHVRDPLSALYPDMPIGQVCPEDVIFTYTKSLAWLQATYPDKARQFGLASDTQDGLVTVLEYQDADEYVLLATGERIEYNQRQFGQQVRVPITVELLRATNPIGRCTAIICPGIGLDYARGGFDGSIGMWQAMAKLMALEAIGMQRAIWPEMWLVDDPGGDGAKVVTHADPLKGIVGRVAGGKPEFLKPEPSVFATQIIDRIERYLRIDAAVPAELGGESTSNIRTGRRGDQILSSVLDFPLQESQELLAVSLQEENKVAVAIDKECFPTSKTFYVSATAGAITYEAPKLFENDTNFVAYAHAGVDAQGLVIELGQLVGTGLISRRSAMESHPLIEDPQSEFDRMYQERIRDALLQGLQQMASDPSAAWMVAQLAIDIRGETEIEDAVTKLHASMQAQQQAAQAQMQGGQPMGPEAQPGMAAAGTSGAAGLPEQIPQPPGSLDNMARLLRELRQGPQAAVPNTLGIAS